MAGVKQSLNASRTCTIHIPVDKRAEFESVLNHNALDLEMIVHYIAVVQSVSSIQFSGSLLTETAKKHDIGMGKFHTVRSDSVDSLPTASFETINVLPPPYTRTCCICLIERHGHSGLPNFLITVNMILASALIASHGTHITCMSQRYDLC
jgi:hypothetical protein